MKKAHITRGIPYPPIINEMDLASRYSATAVSMKENGEIIRKMEWGGSFMQTAITTLANF